MNDTPSLADMSIEEIIAFMPQGMGRLNEKMGVELLEISADRVVATMPVDGNTQPMGLPCSSVITTSYDVLLRPK